MVKNNNVVLEINKNDAFIDTRQISKSKKTFKKIVAGAVVSFVLFSGSTLGLNYAHAEQINQTFSNVDENQVVMIPEAYQSDVARLCGKQVGESITIDDLSKVNSEVEYISASTGSMEWLKYIGHIDELIIGLNGNNAEIFKDIDTLSCTSKLSLMGNNSDFMINANDFAFLKNSPNIKELQLHNVNVEKGLLETLTSVKKMLIDSSYFNDIEYEKLTFLDELRFFGAYDAAIDFTTKEFEQLQKAGVKIGFENNNSIDDYLDINKKLDDIVSSFDIDKNSTDQEKLDAILVYVLENLEYDSAVREKINSGGVAGGSSFYEGGFLYGAFEKDTSICGNYAALTSALAQRLDLNAYFMRSLTHAWNLVEVEGQHYYVDTTWLDAATIQTSEESFVVIDGQQFMKTEYKNIPAYEAIKLGRGNELDWYMEDPTNYPVSNGYESHEADNIPSYIELKPIMTNSIEPIDHMELKSESINNTTPETVNMTNEDNTVKAIDNVKFKISIGKKTYIIGGAALVGILSGLGIAVAVKNNNRKKIEAKKRREEFEQLQQEFYSDYSDYNWNQSYKSR